MRKLRIGWVLQRPGGPNVTEYLAQVTAALDVVQGRFESVWVGDHLQAGSLTEIECTTTIAYFARAYPNLSFASFLCQSYRNPALVAKLGANLQLLTGGRFILGIGAGWKDDEYRAYGYDFPSPAVRVAQLEEAVQVVRRLWTEAPASFDGTYYQIRDAYCVPLPDPPPPIVIGGAGERLLLRVVAKYADWWNCVGGTAETYGHKLSVLRRHCDAVGRDYNEIAKTWSALVLVAETEADAQRLAPPMPADVIKGTPEQVAEQLEPFLQLGMEYFMPIFMDWPSTAGIRLFADEVMPRLRKEI